MSLPPVAAVGAAAAALRAQVVGAAEAELAVALDAYADPAALPSQAAAAPPTGPATDPRQPAVEAARAEAAGRQASLAPLFANLAQAVVAPGLAAPVQAAIARLLALRTPLDGALDAASLQEAVARSGLFLEAHLARGALEGPAPADLKAALLTLQRALTDASGGHPPPGPGSAVTPPPVRGAEPTAQAPAPASLAADDPPAAILQRLLHDVDQAAARQTLLQLASLPDGRAQAWLFELPLATAQGTALAQFEVDHDGHGPAADPASAWRVRFSIALEPLGPVHVHLRLAQGRAAVTVWAERAEGLERLRSLGPELARALPAEVVFHPGVPGQPPPPQSGLFVDRTS